MKYIHIAFSGFCSGTLIGLGINHLLGGTLANHGSYYITLGGILTVIILVNLYKDYETTK